ncbi:immunoglobulin superfamily containing leucine-rich repeat protein 2 [Alligator mississippiensis]|uniref:immunoglobulin superfamily containing leucine-rich repeat protein 2 n=1 Tax=Alligator mississippiensis TaxID=8496 RepID=UPI0003D085F2|nr:immunoglobulin superfamily containing leucine-rich repeat protein 2 [Alligator mississippiensis]XP_019333264.1 immunoglobulin superfamily containing leucine-rich repeat protein 2 [Alligator mississippiensis]XP_059570874.1 immunoglobulin superfamily containing leucine-rich repeat protein 2 [Alligator mississippiensis]
MALLLCLSLAVLLGLSWGCPEPCACMDKYAHQFADCAYKELQAVPAGLPSNVTTLSLSANKITALQRGSFVEVTQVTSLWLAHNEISTIEPGTFAILGQLKNLDISHNQIVDFPWQDLYNLSALQLLKMNNNRMAQLPSDAFQTLKDLRSLRINNNHFASIAEGAFDALSSLSHLQIYNNPFNCTCTLLWLKAWIQNTLISIPERDSISCAAPEPLRGMPLGKIPDLACVAPSVRLTYHPNLDTTELYDGFTLTLQCSVAGSPPPEIRWRIQTSSQALELLSPSLGAPGNQLPPAGASKERFQVLGNGTLVIPHLSKREEGTYTCVATNELGSNQTSVNVAVAGAQKYPLHPLGDPATGKTLPGDRKPSSKGAKNSILKPEEKTKSLIPTRQSHPGAGKVQMGPGEEEEEVPFQLPNFKKKCGSHQATQYVSNHAFNQSGDFKQHTFDLGVIALDVSEREAKVQLTPFYGQPEKVHLRVLYLCQESAQGHALVQWSKIEEGVNSYWFQGLSPGTNYSVCLTFLGEDCQVQVVFTTKKEIPSLIIIVVVSIFLLALATLPLLGATFCHLLSKYQGKTYKLIMKPQNPDQMEKHMAADFDPRASYLESEKNYNSSEAGEGEAEEEEEEEEEREVEGGERELEPDGSLVATSLPESQSKANQEEFEVGSEYSDKLPLGAEAVNISQEINGNYRQPAR